MNKLHLSREQAEQRFRKVKPLIDKKITKRRYIYARIIKSQLQTWIYRLAYLTNWKASFLWTFKLKRLAWIGKSFNPDYTQACAQSTCALAVNACNVGEYCTTVTACVNASPCAKTGGCGCTAPLPHSTQLSGCTVTCAVTGTCGCASHYCTINTCTIVSCLTGTCGYNCDGGYTWNGSQCVASGGQQLFTLINQEDY
jgi:hypothetical protein